MPPEVRAQAPPALMAISTRKEVTLFLREDAWNLKRYPRACPLELRLGTWEIDKVLLVALAVRVARIDLLCFDCWLDIGNANGVRIIQNLADQPRIDVYLVADDVARSFRVSNPAQLICAQLVDKIREREAWTPEEFQQAMARVNQLYPTPRAVWAACEPETTDESRPGRPGPRRP